MTDSTDMGLSLEPATAAAKDTAGSSLSLDAGFGLVFPLA